MCPDVEGFIMDGEDRAEAERDGVEEGPVG